MTPSNSLLGASTNNHHEELELYKIACREKDVQIQHLEKENERTKSTIKNLEEQLVEFKKVVKELL